MKKFVMILVLCFLSLQVAAWADGGGGPREKPAPNKKMMDHLMKIQEALKLTDQQINDIQEKCFAFKRERIKERASLELALVDLREMKSKDTPDLKKIEGKIREIAGIKADMEIKRLKCIEDAKSVLNETQKDTLKKLKKRPYLMKALAEDENILDSGATADVEGTADGDELVFLQDVFGSDF